MRLLLLLVPSLLIGCRQEKITTDDTDGTTGSDTGTAADADTDADTDTDADADTDTDTVASGEISVAPSSLTFDTIFVGGTATKEVTISNVGDGPVSLAATVSGAELSAYTVTLSDPAPAPHTDATLTLTLTPTNWGDHSVSLNITDTTGTGHVTVPVAAWVQEDTDGDGYGSVQSGGDDCNDANAGINPGVADTWYDGIDSNCDGANDYDQDADGVTVDTDCDDTVASVYPGAPDTWYDGVDSDCAGNDDFDQDGDGYDSDVDCADTDAAIHPDAAETWYDGVDQDCDGRDDDQDGDGYALADDCDDTNAAINPGAADTWYDGIDSNCAGDDDYDQDLDGTDYPTDCDDTDAGIGGPTTEVWDGLDNDCDGTIDDLSITDAASGVLYGPTSSLALGSTGGLSLGGDLTGDGADDLVVASSASGNGYAWVVSGATAATAAGSVSSYSTAAITGASYYPIQNMVGPMVDVTGDGTADLLIDGDYSSRYYGYLGHGYVLTGGSSLTGSLSTSTTYRAYFDGDSDSDYLRWIVAGDVDGDGDDDIVTGAAYDNFTGSYYSGTYYSGNVAVFEAGTFSGAYDLGDAADQINGGDDYDYLGYSLAIADVDGDGYADILAGAPGEDAGGSAAGAIYVISGNADLAWDDTVDDAATAKFAGAAASDGLGTDPLATPGDVDGDGAIDLVFTNSGDGVAYLFYDAAAYAGSASVSSAGLTFSNAGSSVAYDLDLDGDGADEVVLGKSGDDTAASNAGAVYAFQPGGATGTWTTANATFSISGAAADDALGAAVAGGGDADGDGRDDLLVGASGSDGGASNGGAVYVVLGR